MYKTTLTTRNIGQRIETHVLRVWSKGQDKTEVPYRTHVSKNYPYIVKLEKEYLAQ